MSAGCRTLDSGVQPVADGSSNWRGHRERHQTLVKLLSTYTVLENIEYSLRFTTGCIFSGDQSLDIYFLQMKF